MAELKSFFIIEILHLLGMKSKFDEGEKMNCDNCKYYEWYYDHCRKWDCEIDAREVHNCYEPYDTPIRDNMVNYSK